MSSRTSLRLRLLRMTRFVSRGRKKIVVATPRGRSGSPAEVAHALKAAVPHCPGEHLKAEITECGMRIWSASELPVVLTLRLFNWKIIDASEPYPHQPVLVEFPIFVAIRPKPIS